jgi:hypothetical protein
MTAKRPTQSNILDSIKDLLTALQDQQVATNAIMSIMASDLGRIAASLQPAAPNFTHPLAAYRDFDWEAMGAVVQEKDQYGAAIIHWNGHTWKRRNGDSNFGKAIWFSRPDRKTAEGKINYIRLITFKDSEPVKALTFDKLAGHDNGANSHPDPVLAAHLRYKDGTHVPKNQKTIEAFNAFMYIEQRKPASSTELQAWHEQREIEATS